MMLSNCCSVILTQCCLTHCSSWYSHLTESHTEVRASRWVESRWKFLSRVFIILGRNEKLMTVDMKWKYNGKLFSPNIWNESLETSGYSQERTLFKMCKEWIDQVDPLFARSRIRQPNPPAFLSYSFKSDLTWASKTNILLDTSPSPFLDMFHHNWPLSDEKIKMI